jgi:hypothetical protein
VRFVAVHPIRRQVTPRCNTACSSFAPRQPGALRGNRMELVGIVMLGSVALWLLQHFDRSTQW